MASAGRKLSMRAKKLSYTGRIDFHGIEGLRYGAALSGPISKGTDAAVLRRSLYSVR